MRRSIFVFFIVASGIAALAVYNHRTQPAKKEITIFDRDYFVSGTDTLWYELHVSESLQMNKKYPLLVLLHGAVERAIYNTITEIQPPQLFRDPEQRKNYPCYIFMPHCPDPMTWMEPAPGDTSHRLPEKITLPSRLAVLLLDSLLKDPKIDRNRIYITGVAMGGFGTWDLICRYPEKFTCALPLCGGGDESCAPQLINIPIWAWHGKPDPYVPVHRTISMVEAINAAGGKAKMTLMENHYNVWDSAYSSPEVFDWMFAQHK